jgi:hypothetical protein
MPATDYALVVGIDRYPALRSLLGAEADAQDFYRWVTDPVGGGVPPANATLVVTSLYRPTDVIDDALPAKQQIEKFFTCIENLAQENNKAGKGLKTGNRLYMFFAGHGFATSLDRSGVLMANATNTILHNIAPFLWLDRLYQGGWFDEVLLFQDACRNRIPDTDTDLTPPFLKFRLAPVGQDRKRFYAFAAKERQLAQEKRDGNGQVHGVFSATLLAGLSGGARHPVTGEVTTAQLKSYLQDNMCKRLSDAERADPVIAKRPEVWASDEIVIVPAAPIPKFPVRVSLPAANLNARIEYGGREFLQAAAANPAPQPWDLMLPRGIYRLVAQGCQNALFEVTGAVQTGGAPEVLDVRIG